MNILDKKARSHEEALCLAINADGTHEIVASGETAGRGSMTPAWGQSYRGVLNYIVQSLEKETQSWLKFHASYTQGKTIPKLTECIGATYQSREAVHFVSNEQAYTAFVGTDHKGGFLGYDGRRVTITLENGEIIESNNLWHSGTVPAYLREVLRDNATIKWH